MEKSRVLEAAKKHKAGFNCCQAVVCTYADLLGIDETTCFRVSEGFGLESPRSTGPVVPAVRWCLLPD